MAIPYLNIARAVMLRTGQLADAATAAAFETLYTSALATALGGMEVPLSELKRLVLASEKRIAGICCRQENPILKMGMADRTVDLASGAALPTLDNDSDEFVGIFGAVHDALTGLPLTEKPIQEITRINRLIASGFLRIAPHHFVFHDQMIFHTRAGGAYIAGYAWDYTAQATAYGASGNSPLSQEVESWWIADCLENAAQEGWFMQEAGIYSQIAANCAREAKEGAIPSAILPDTTASAEPVKN